MMEKSEDFKRIMMPLILASLLILTFFLLKPILLSIITGLILAFIFTPLYEKIYKIIKSKNLAAIFVCILLLAIILLPLWFLTPIIVKQSLRVYLSLQHTDLVGIIKNFFPSLPETFMTEFGNVVQSFVAKLANSITNSLSNIILNFPIILLHLIVLSFTFFFALRDGKELITYIKCLSPFSKETEKRLFDYSMGITESVIYGQIIIGLIQGFLTGVGFLIFNVPNAIFLALLTIFASILPVLGPVVIWAPVVIYMLIGGDTFGALGVLFFGSIASTLDNFLRPIIVSRRTRIPTSLILIGMIGGLLLFGILGFILGPLILGFLLIILELYKKKDSAFSCD